MRRRIWDGEGKRGIVLADTWKGYDTEEARTEAEGKGTKQTKRTNRHEGIDRNRNGMEEEGSQPPL